jgi:general stress protein YciG
MKQIRGFAAMSRDKRTAIARRGGLAVADDKRSFAKDRQLARDAGRKGGERAAALRAERIKLKEGQRHADD